MSGKKPIELDKLKTYLWNSAVLLRTNIDAGAYKQYIFPLLFCKRLCDVYDEETRCAGSRGGKAPHSFAIPAGAHWRYVRNVTKMWERRSWRPFRR